MQMVVGPAIESNESVESHPKCTEICTLGLPTKKACCCFFVFLFLLPASEIYFFRLCFTFAHNNTFCLSNECLQAAGQTYFSIGESLGFPGWNVLQWIRNGWCMACGWARWVEWAALKLGALLSPALICTLFLCFLFILFAIFFLLFFVCRLENMILFIQNVQFIILPRSKISVATEIPKENTREWLQLCAFNCEKLLKSKFFLLIFNIYVSNVLGFSSRQLYP